VTPYLSLDTATRHASLAVGAPGAACLERAVEERSELSRGIERLASLLLEQAGVRRSDLAGVIVADGPGSFTGLRIGAAFAKGVCRALGIPLLTAPSLLGAARAALEGPGTAVARYDALRGEVYQAVYTVAQDGAVSVLQAPALHPDVGAPLPPGAAVATERHASAATLLRLVGVGGGVVAVGEASSWEPVYGRPAEAEARLRREQARDPRA